MGDADAALLEAKEAGGGAVALFNGPKTSSLSWVERIRRALANDLLVLHSQPIVVCAAAGSCRRSCSCGCKTTTAS